MNNLEMATLWPPSVPAVASSASNVTAKNGQKNMKEHEELTYADMSK